MRLRLEASPEELKNKSSALIGALADAIFPVDPELAEQLEKALPRSEPSLKYPVLRTLHERTARAYRKQLDAMSREISAVLDQSKPVNKGHDHTKAIADRDNIAFERVKEVLRRNGYTEADFDEGGRLCGRSVNELLESLRPEGLS